MQGRFRSDHYPVTNLHLIYHIAELIFKQPKCPIFCAVTRTDVFDAGSSDPICSFSYLQF